MATLTQNLNDGVSGIRKAIKSVCTRAGSLQDDIQAVAVATLKHTHEHGDWTLSVELIDGLSQSNGVKKTKLTQWFESFMGATFGKDEGTGNNVFEYDKGRNASDINMEQAEAVKWYDFKSEKASVAKDLQAIVKQFVKAGQKSVKAGKMEQAQLTAAVTFFEGLADIHEGDVLEVDFSNALDMDEPATAATAH